MGNHISDADCAAVGVIGSIYWASPSTDRGKAVLIGTLEAKLTAFGIISPPFLLK